MCYTSGTTGDPKGVLYSHRSVVLHSIGACLADALGVSEADVILPVVPMFHANAWGLCQAAVMAGSKLVFTGADLSPQAVTNLIRRRGGHPGRRRAHHLDGRPAPAGRAAQHQLRTIVCGGSAVPKALSEAYRQEVGLPILQAWGMTETSPLATVARVRRERREAARVGGGAGRRPRHRGPPGAAGGAAHRRTGHRARCCPGTTR